MTDKFVRRFNASASNRVTTDSIAVIMYSLTVIVKIANEFSDFFLYRTITGLHSFKPPNHIIHFGIKKPRYCAFHPFQAFLRSLTILQLGHLVNMLCTMVIVQYLSAFWKACHHMFPQPVGSVTQQSNAKVILGDLGCHK